MGFIVGAACALQLQIKAVRINTSQQQGRVMRACFVALHQRLPHRPGLRARECDQPFIAFAQPVPFQHCLTLDNIARVGARDQLGNIEIALLVLHQQHQAGGCGGVRTQAFDQHLCANQRLDTLSPAFLVELDRTKQVIEIGNRQGALAVFGRHLDGVVDTVGTVNDGKFCVQAEVNKHAAIVGSWPKEIVLLG